LTALLAIAGLIAVAVVLLKVTKGESGGGGSAHELSIAIGVAEGGYDSSGNNLNNGTLPSKNHNPGDLTVDTIGKATGKNGNFVVYASDADGWAALDQQVNLWLTGQSANATADSTIAEISQFYTTNDQTAWASNVAAVLGVTVDTPIGQITSGGSSPATSSQDQTADASPAPAASSDLTIGSLSDQSLESGDTSDDGGLS
jgi:hypothetical protein